SGRTDFFVETGLKAWDVAAGRIIVEEAGGEYREFPSGHSTLFYAGNKSIDMESLCKELAGI
ncbi:MAG TPA: inositol monophosphatase family protein, partial [bacterium]|nr:inositol monophosphatase family protein [bacterium]